MEKREEIQKKADDKLLGRLKDEKDFAKQLAENPDLGKVIADTSLAMEAIAAAEDQALKARLQKLESSLAAKRKDSPLRVVREEAEDQKIIPLHPPFWKRNMAAIAAAVALVLVAGYYLLMPANTPEESDLFATNFEPFPNIAVDLTRSNDPTAEAIAFTAYENKNYAKAEDMIKALGDQPVYQFYLAQVKLAQNDYSAAEALLRPLASNDTFPLQQEANWYLALTELSLDKTNAAKNRLKSISSQADHPFSEKATALGSSL